MVDYRLFKRTRRGKTTFWIYYWQNGRRVHRSTGKATIRAAEDEARKLVADIQEPGNDPTLESFARGFFDPSSEWVTGQRAAGHAISDVVSGMRQSQLRRYVLPEWGRCRLSEIDGVGVERWLLGLRLSNQTRNHLLYSLNIVLKEAVRQGKLARNPLDVARRFAVGVGRYRETRPYSTAELAKLFPASDRKLLGIWGSWYWASLFLTLASSGVRPQEARALRWSRVLWDQGAILILEAAKPGGGYGPPKGNERRGILVPARTLAALKQWRTASPLAGDDHLVWFGNADPILAPIRHESLQHHLAAAQRKLKLPPGRSLRSFRHTFNTVYRDLLPEAVLRGFTGHRSEKMTDRYDHPEWTRRLEPLKAFRPLIESAWKSARAAKG